MNDLEVIVPNTPKTPYYDDISQIYTTRSEMVFPVEVGNATESYRLVIGGAQEVWESIGVQDDMTFAEFIHLENGFTDESHWKAHLSIHPGDLARAWDLLYPVLAAESKYKFKVARQAIANEKQSKIDAANIPQAWKNEALIDQQRVSNGMQVTVYMPQGDEQRFKHLLEHCEELLQENNIRPGVIHMSDLALGNFVSIRQESRYDAKYGLYRGYKYEESSLYKAVDQQDLFESFKNQLPWDPNVIGHLDFKEQIRAIDLRLKLFVNSELAFTELSLQINPDIEAYTRLEREMRLHLDILLREVCRWEIILSSLKPEQLALNKSLDKFNNLIGAIFEFANEKNKAILLQGNNPELFISPAEAASTSQMPTPSPETSPRSNLSINSNQGTEKSTAFLGNAKKTQNPILISYKLITAKANTILTHIQKTLTIPEITQGGTHFKYGTTLFNVKNEEQNARQKIDSAKQADTFLQQNNADPSAQRRAFTTLAETQAYLNYWSERVNQAPNDFPASFKSLIQDGITELQMRDYQGVESDRANMKLGRG